jgi:DNA-binding MarR family transcriptional regulator
MDAANKTKLVESILILSDGIFRKLLPTVPKEILSLDVTMPQMKIMLMLFMHGPMRMSAIASEMDVALPTATSFIDRLAEKNYVVRENQPNDRRVVLCNLTEAGQKAIGGIWESGRKNIGNILEEMDDRKLQMLAEVLQSMLEMAEASAMQSPVQEKQRINN